MYRAPVKDIRFVLDELIDGDALRACPEFADYSSETADAVLGEAARFAETILDPLCKSGDREGAHWSANGVTMPEGFRAAYLQFCESGWPALRAETEFGGQNVPAVLGTAVEELWAGANLAFKLCPMLTQGAIEAIQRFASEPQKQLYLPKMVRGEWTGTMNLTEPQAGSDLAQVRTRAVPAGPNYRIHGQKIFITYGEHDLTENIVHMVLARIDGAPPGTRGISLFMVPKFWVNADGKPGARNDVYCASIEHKLGIHASPTCVMMYGENEGALGLLVGEANRGLEYMFAMMNAARLSVGVEGHAQAERAFQQAAEWARTRVQGKPPVPLAKVAGSASMGTSSSPAPIIGHPDVKRMLLDMKSRVEACRALALYAAYQLDLGHAHPDVATRAVAQARGDLLIPIVKGFCTDSGVDIASIGIQVHGGMGFVEETGAAQTLRDVRITTIYEGTTGIQSNDLIGRKFGRDRGAAMMAFIAEMQESLEALHSPHARALSARVAALDGVVRLRAASEALLGHLAGAPDRAMAVSVPFLKLCGIVIGGWLMARAADVAANRLEAGAADREFLEGKLATAQFYADQVLPQALAFEQIVKTGSDAVVSTDAAYI
ncbi:MAG TPA: acyl-CoA dehydrogenase C-terminal domain-containing protein [Steroidobacteraceae bacterium]|jgi:alkylation response protein AidB-like acyl-CoA dehydrogenase|nr:acyl-CoA dehydrogenase C-terminal domain-containing protein [Steroidobacteraceae bacterium]